MRRPPANGAAASLLAPVFLGLLAGALRFFDLGAPALWCDEAFSYLQAMRPWSSVHLAADAYPPLYLYVLKATMAAFGSSETALRLPSAVFGTMTVLAGYFVAARWFGRKAAFWMGVLWAVLPFHIYYSREIRMYALVGLEAIGVLYFWDRALDEDRTRDWTVFGIIALLGLYTHYWFTFFAFSLGAWSIAARLRTRQPLLRPMTVFLTLAVLFAPWVPRLLDQAAAVPLLPNKKPIFRMLWQTALSFSGTETASAALGGPPGIPWFVNGKLAFVSWAALVGMGLALSPRRDRSGRAFMAGGLGPILLAIVTVLLYRPVLNPRYTIVALPAIFLAMAPAFRAQGRAVRGVFVAAASIFLISMLPLLPWHYRSDMKGPWRSFADPLREFTEGQKTVALSVGKKRWKMMPMRYYAPGMRWVRSVDRVRRPIDRLILMGPVADVESTADDLRRTWRPGPGFEKDGFRLLALDRRARR